MVWLCGLTRPQMRLAKHRGAPSPAGTPAAVGPPLPRPAASYSLYFGLIATAVTVSEGGAGMSCCNWVRLPTHDNS